MLYQPILSGIVIILSFLPGTPASPRVPRIKVTEALLPERTIDTHPVANPASRYSGRLRKAPGDLRAMYPFPKFTINALDDEHTVSIHGIGGDCLLSGNTIAQITGVPKAIMESERWRKGVAQGGLAQGASGDWGHHGQVEGNLMWDPKVDDNWGKQKADWKPSVPEEIADKVLKAGIIGHAYGNPLRVGEGQSSPCIQIDILGQGAESVFLQRSTLKVPRTMAAMWHAEDCVGEPDRWLAMLIGKETTCGREPHAPGALWRSMRVWYGSERLAPEQFGEGRISLTDELTVWRGGQ